MVRLGWVGLCQAGLGWLGWVELGQVKLGWLCLSGWAGWLGWLGWVRLCWLG